MNEDELEAAVERALRSERERREQEWVVAALVGLVVWVVIVAAVVLL